LDLILGYRFYGLSDHIQIRENLQVLNFPPLTAGTRIDVTDTFRATNQFHGADVGFSTDLTRGRWTMDGRVFLLAPRLGAGQISSVMRLTTCCRWPRRDG
jgi:hypothetical protein